MTGLNRGNRTAIIFAVGVIVGSAIYMLLRYN